MTLGQCQKTPQCPPGLVYDVTEGRRLCKSNLCRGMGMFPSLLYLVQHHDHLHYLCRTYSGTIVDALLAECLHKPPLYGFQLHIHSSSCGIYDTSMASRLSVCVLDHDCFEIRSILMPVALDSLRHQHKIS